jgi:cytidylate kinase
LLAQQLGCDYVSASQLMFDELGYHDPGDHGTWVRSSSEISTKREDGSVDREVNRKLLALARGTSRIVFDSWTLPFMVRETSDLGGQVIFLRLDSNMRSRAVKSLVSLGAGAQLSVTAATRLVGEKDASSRQIFVRTFGFDIFRPADYFGPGEQLIINVGEFVYGVNPDQVRKGVRDAHQRVMLRITEWPGGL